MKNKFIVRIIEIHTLSLVQTEDLLELMHELDPEIAVTAEMLERAANTPQTHLYAAMNNDGHIIGCASLCVFNSPTGQKASIEDVVVSVAFRGQGIGKALMEHIIGYAQRELAPMDLNLTSRPERVAANELYRKMGFERRGTNVYRMRVLRGD